MAAFYCWSCVVFWSLEDKREADSLLVTNLSSTASNEHQIDFVEVEDTNLIWDLIPSLVVAPVSYRNCRTLGWTY